MMRAVVLAVVLAACGTDDHSGAGIDVEQERHASYPCNSGGTASGDRLPLGSVFVSAFLCDPGTGDCEDITADSYMDDDRRIHSRCEIGRTLRLTWLEPDPPLDTGAID